MSARHELKTDSAVFEAVATGAKTYEIRRNDRGFAVGDELMLRETVYTGDEMAGGAELLYTGRTATRTVSHILTGYGLRTDWCILSFALGESSQNAGRLDWLEEIGNQPEGLLLHSGAGSTGRRGLGLGKIGRTLRQAIDAARGRADQDGEPSCAR